MKKVRIPSPVRIIREQDKEKIICDEKYIKT